MLKNIFKTIAAAALLSASFGGNANAAVVTKYFDVSITNFVWESNSNINISPPPPNPIHSPINAEFAVTFDPTVSMTNWQNSGVSLISTNTPLRPDFSFYYTGGSNGFGGMGIEDYNNISFDLNVWFIIHFSPSNPDLMTASYSSSYYYDSQGNLFFSGYNSPFYGTVTVNNAVPLPPSFGLFVAALGGLAFTAYRRKQAAI